MAELPEFDHTDFQQAMVKVILPGEELPSAYDRFINDRYAVFRCTGGIVDWLLPLFEEDAMWGLHGPVELIGARHEDYTHIQVTEVWYQRGDTTH